MVDKLNAIDLLPDSDVIIPSVSNESANDISRWSSTRVFSPAAIVVPTTEDAIIALVRYADRENLKVVPAGGGHGTFVPIDEHCIYLNMKKFNSICLDADTCTVTLGGGVVSGDLVRYLTERGFYTSTPNSNAVGMVGYTLGGGSAAINGLKGLAIDNLIRARVITAEGKVVEVGPLSEGKDGDLYRVLCGAGFGFAVVISITLRIWPISELRMDVGKVWTRKLLFPPAAIDAAAKLFTELQHPDPKMTAVLLFMRAPPSAPRPSAPIIMLIINYFGPGSEAEKAAAPTFDLTTISQAILAETSSASMNLLNDASAPLDRHGDYKEQYSAWSSGVSDRTIVSAFNNWLAFGESTPAAKETSFLVFAAKGTKGMLDHDIGGRKFFPRALRGRNVFVQAVPWWTDEAAEDQARSWAAETMALVNAPQHDVLSEASDLVDGQELTAYANNLSKGIDLRTTWTGKQLEEIQRIKGIWDSRGVFWNPVVDGV